MRYIFHLMVIFYSLSSKGQQPVNADAIVGRWESARNNLIVDVYKEGITYKAKIVWFKLPKGSTQPADTWLDEKNPNSSLQSRKVLGMDVLNNLIYNEKTNRWEKGEIYDSTSGRTWGSSVWLTEDGLLKVRGFWHVELIGQTMIFRRI